MRAQILCLGLLLGMGASSRAEHVPPLAGVTIVDGRLSVELHDAPLAAVVTDIAARTGIVLHMDQARALPRVTARFSDLPFAEGLTRLLKAAPGSLVVGNAKRGYAGVAALYVIAGQGEAGPLPQPPPATMEDLRRSIEALPVHEARPDIRQAYDAALEPPPAAPAEPAPAVQSAQQLDNALRAIGGATPGLSAARAAPKNKQAVIRQDQGEPRP
jgi:hypothetical protein